MAKRRGITEELSEIVDGTARITLTLRSGKQYEVLLDEEDLPIWTAHTWGIRDDGDGGCYVVRDDHSTGKHRRVYLHRVLMDAPKGLEVDHANLRTLDNRRVNLRLATRSQNMANGRVRTNNTSGAVGVSWHAQAKKWRAYLRIDGKLVNLGLFRAYGAAFDARLDAERQLFGQFAPSNRTAA
jgi:hypothetical protein